MTNFSCKDQMKLSAFSGAQCLVVMPFFKIPAKHSIILHSFTITLLFFTLRVVILL